MQCCELLRQSAWHAEGRVSEAALVAGSQMEATFALLSEPTLALLLTPLLHARQPYLKRRVNVQNHGFN